MIKTKEPLTKTHAQSFQHCFFNCRFLFTKTITHFLFFYFNFHSTLSILSQLFTIPSQLQGEEEEEEEVKVQPLLFIPCQFIYIIFEMDLIREKSVVGGQVALIKGGCPCVSECIGWRLIACAQTTVCPFTSSIPSALPTVLIPSAGTAVDCMSECESGLLLEGMSE